MDDLPDRILARLQTNGPATVADLAKRFEVNEGAVLNSLYVGLGGLVEMRPDGRWRLKDVNQEGM